MKVLCGAGLNFSSIRAEEALSPALAENAPKGDTSRLGQFKTIPILSRDVASVIMWLLSDILLEPLELNDC